MTEERINKTLVADAGVLFSAIAYDGLERKVVALGKPRLLVTENVEGELLKALSKAGIWREEAASKVEETHLETVSRARFEHNMDRALRIIGDRDPSDAPTIALAFSVENDGIWSSDKDFQAAGGSVKIWSSRELLDALGRAARR